jgi:chromosome partitioning protein
MALSQHGTLAPVILHHRTGFAAAMIDGRTVMEVPGEARSAEEIELLWQYLAKRLNRDFGTMLPAALLSSAPKDGDPETADHDGSYEQGAS